MWNLCRPIYHAALIRPPALSGRKRETVGQRDAFRILRKYMDARSRAYIIIIIILEKQERERK